MEKEVIEELHKRNSSGSLPILIDVQHDKIVWGQKYLQTGKYENGHIRLINDTRGVIYKGQWYFPSAFNYSAPSDDGKIEAKASVTVTAIDKSFRTTIDNMDEGGTATITTVFEKISTDEVVFTPIKTLVFEISDVTWDKLTAKWTLARDPVSTINIPRDLGTIQRCPSVVY